ncbi:hypothetical protein PAXRUDRAFT_36940 [Paxillus rubicundulus Ve08.2h10]|uniref:CxC2-like cysteine cluster KDZ transposase-associated domain-containing protein n=1 Tax=Paxillus rubicundulus Ve08.2h10 TaxID=930991 RepID=A0A0D0CLJ5_9AGAM|nr:hypothetical protein PAXRUDRAFT_36940 [Paxillus rubicundulus Ve08.2h10]
MDKRCYRPCPAIKDDLIVVHTNGVHSIGLDFCGCEDAEVPAIQLLRMQWFPASTNKSHTAAMYSVLEQFHLLSLESKVLVYEYYNALAHLPDNTGLAEPKDHHEQFLRMIQEWHHLKMVKQSGCGHNKAVIVSTQEGECAVLYPACIREMNLPSNWDQAPPEKQWLYGATVSIDAKFRLKHKAVSKDAVDPSLSCGWAYFLKHQ